MAHLKYTRLYQEAMRISKQLATHHEVPSVAVCHVAYGALDVLSRRKNARNASSDFAKPATRIRDALVKILDVPSELPEHFDVKLSDQVYALRNRSRVNATKARARTSFVFIEDLVSTVLRHSLVIEILGKNAERDRKCVLQACDSFHPEPTSARKVPLAHRPNTSMKRTLRRKRAS